jgi:RND family efflux transporter MFP subunit
MTAYPSGPRAARTLAPARAASPGGRSRRPLAASLAAPLALALAAAALGACKGGNQADAASPDAAANTTTVGPENVAFVARDSVQSGPSLSGSLEPERQATLRAEVGGTVTAAPAEAGQRVGTGAVLARIETVGIADQAISARAGVAAAEVAYEIAQRNLDRSERLFAAGAVAEREVESARSQARSAQAQLSAAQAQRASANRQLRSATVTAPFPGVVGTKTVSVGDVVNVGSELFTVVDPSSMQLRGSVPADQLSQVRVGAPVRFTVTGYPDRQFTGKITRVSPVADPSTRQVQILASIPNAGNALVGGLFAEGRVASETRDALVVPSDAVDQRGVQPAIVRVKGGKVERVNVELGLRDDARELVEVRTGVAPGDTLLRGAAQGISAGTLVRVSQPSDARAATAAPAAASKR